MIKPEKTRKIPENSEKPPKIFQITLNFREKSPKNPKNLPVRFARRLGGGLPAAKLGGYFPKKIYGGYFGYTPPLAMSDSCISRKNFNTNFNDQVIPGVRNRM